ncbi:MerR family transcriptional regulator [Reinekea sp. G2M2-21]|uniref:MerR family transcriptional regulator n=1 Tax=Reinekea sp. G2M2-21 TaxID=2788942 RepID=UPI0018AC2652|nr:MerR family transcriptional regulator [Reinekea sp. G2M2-21]
MYIGEFAQQCGVSVKTVRYYEQLGLLPEVQRQGKYRVFDDAAQERMQLIQLCKKHGLTLAEIEEFIRYQTQSSVDRCQRTLTYIHRKKREFSEQIQTLQEKVSQLQQLESKVRENLSVERV